jgi:hypothetical protein
MVRRVWDDLPESVRGAIEARTGPVERAEIPSAGRNSDFSATLHTSGDLLFCKGVNNAEGRRGVMHRHEADINPWLPSAVVARLRWRAEVDGWLVLGFDHVPGRHADLSPRSPDLPLVLNTVTTLARELRACPAPGIPTLADKMARLAGWRRLRADPPAGLDPWSRDRLDMLVEWEARGGASMAGHSLLHTDLHPLNILVSDRARVIDWAWSRLGAAWVDTAYLVIRLIYEGHAPDVAEDWASTTGLFVDVSSADLTAFSIAVTGAWTYLEHADPQPHRGRLTAAARRWTQFRLCQQ